MSNSFLTLPTASPSSHSEDDPIVTLQKRVLMRTTWGNLHPVQVTLDLWNATPHCHWLQSIIFAHKDP